MFQKVSEWLNEKSDHFIRGNTMHQGGYYGSPEAEEAYGAMRGADNQPEQEEPEAQESAEAAQQRGAMQPDYGGRVPYQSQRAQPEGYAQQSTGYAQPSAYAQQPAPYGQQPGTEQGARRAAVYPPREGYGAPAQQGPYAQPRQAYPQQGYQQPAPSNVVPFPGMQRAPDGNVYAHAEYIVLLRSRNECKNVIEYIKANASVFLNMEFIASDSERQRCVDMLSGAAYTLGCQLNKISPRGIYLISSPSVYVVIDPAMQKFASGQEARGFARQSYAEPAYSQPRASMQGQSPMQAQDMQRPAERPAARAQAYAQSTPFAMQGASAPTSSYKSVPPPQPRMQNGFGMQSATAGDMTSNYAPPQGGLRTAAGGGRAFDDYKQ